MKILYFDCFSGVSGDMILGALVGLGADLNAINRCLGQMVPEKMEIKAKQVAVNGLGAVEIDMILDKGMRLRHLKDIESLLSDSPLDAKQRQTAMAVFHKIAECEAGVHRTDPENIHFHEIGALDTIADVVGTILALDQLGVSEIHCSPVPLARGECYMAHGMYPLPSPATLELLKGVPCYGMQSEFELVTPTGAALLVTLASSFGEVPPMVISGCAYGAGKMRSPKRPNVLRAVIGDPYPVFENERIGVVEANVDDMQDEMFSYLFDRFFSLPGALDMVVHTALGKKNRPCHIIKCIVRPEAVWVCVDFLLRETSTLGVRYRWEQRKAVKRWSGRLPTPWGEVEVKIWQDPSGDLRVAPEYEAARTVALNNRIPLWKVYEEVYSKRAWALKILENLDK